MHDEHVGLALLEAGHVQAEEGDVFAHGGEKAALLALVLMRRSMITSASGRTESRSCANLDAELREDVGHERGRPDQGDARAELGQRPDIGARDAAEEDVAADDDVEILPLASAGQPLAHGKGVEQRLGRVLVRAVRRR